MSFLGIGGNNTGKNARFYQGQGQYSPYGVTTGAGSISWRTPVISGRDWKKIRRGQMAMPSGQATFNESPETRAIREMLMSGAGYFSGSAMDTGVPGYAGITPELFGTMNDVNANIDALGVPEETLDPETLAAMIDDSTAQRFLGLSKQFGDELAGSDFNQMQADRLAISRAMDAARESRLRQGNADDQFSYGNLASSAGQYQTAGLEEALGNIDLGRKDRAFGEAMGYRGLLADLAQGFGSTGYGMQADKAGFLGNLMSGLFEQRMAGNQLQGQRQADRFARAAGLAGMGKQFQGLDTQNALGYLGGISDLNNYQAGLIGLGGSLGSARSAANNEANMPMVKAGIAADKQDAETGQQIAQIISMFFSDRRLKHDIEKVGEHNGVNLYKWKWANGTADYGVMADEVPHAAFKHPSGYYMVDYARIW